ncbi:MAG: phosphoribosylformylglycinamidine synthase subunit PurS [Pseudomonadota bacterium]
MKAIVHVGLKPGVLDPQGKAVADTLGRMGFAEVEGARIGKVIELDLVGLSEAEAKARVTEMCETLLANTVIESYRVELVD